MDAVPVLLRRLLTEARCFGVGVGRPIRRKQAEFRSREPVQAAVRLALLQPECSAVLLLFDGEDDCPKILADNVRKWAKEVAGITPCDVVIAYREYETWFLAAVESLRGKYGIRMDAVVPINPEARRDAKSALEEFMPANRAYSETGDQPGMSDVFDMGLAYQRNRSFRKLVKTVGDMLSKMNHHPYSWPPSRWSQHRSL